MLIAKCSFYGPLDYGFLNFRPCHKYTNNWIPIHCQQVQVKVLQNIPQCSHYAVITSILIFLTQFYSHTVPCTMINRMKNFDSKGHFISIAIVSLKHVHRRRNLGSAFLYFIHIFIGRLNTLYISKNSLCFTPSSLAKSHSFPSEWLKCKK